MKKLKVRGPILSLVGRQLYRRGVPMAVRPAAPEPRPMFPTIAVTDGTTCARCRRESFGLSRRCPYCGFVAER